MGPAGSGPVACLRPGGGWARYGDEDHFVDVAGVGALGANGCILLPNILNTRGHETPRGHQKERAAEFARRKGRRFTRTRGCARSGIGQVAENWYVE